MKLRSTNRGVSLLELLVVLIVAAILTAGVVTVHKMVTSGFSRQRLVGDTQTIGNIGFFLVGRDIRRAGSNPKGALGINAGTAIPFAIAEPQRIEILADLNGDGDILDTDEDVVYEYVDLDPKVAGKDTVTRTSGGSSVTYITNVYGFKLAYVMLDNSEVDVPDPVASVRMVRVALTVGSSKADPQTGQPIQRTFETLIGLRNYQ